MNISTFPTSSMKLLIVILLHGVLGGLSSAAPRPNIILCMADDMGWGDPGYNSRTVTMPDGSPHPDQGWISTPTLDAMAASGLRFNRFYSASAVCSPTRASCLTGRNPFRVGVPTANAGRLGFGETPLSEILSAEGYRCGHFGKWHLGSMTTLRSDSNRGGNAGVYSAPWHHRYDVCFATESKVPTYHPYRKTDNSLPLPTSFNDPNFYGTRYWRMPVTWNEASGEGDAVPVGEVNDATNGDDSKLLVDQAIPFIQDSVAQGTPFFIVLWFHTPHKPTVDPEGVTGTDSSDSLKDSIEDLDTALGRVRDELTALGVRGNTMFWVTSDNGPENGQDSPNESSTVRSIRSGRLLERKRSLHEGGVRVPGILEWPDVITSGRFTDIPAVTSDYYPTILDYLELSVPDQKPLDGISLRPVIEGTATTRTKPIGFKFGGDKSWLSQRYKLINDGSGWELHDLIDIAPGEEAEQTPVANAGNVTTKSRAVQNTYNTMLAEYSAWDATVASDTPYVHASQPTVTLTTSATTPAEPFTVTATFSEPVTQLHPDELAVTHATVSEFSGEGTTWTFLVTPQAGNGITIHLPEGTVIDADGNPNAPSNQLDVTTPVPPGLEGSTVDTVLPPLSLQTVDSQGNVPGNLSNNILKFTAGTINDGVANPFTSTLYVRSSSSDPLRRVRAFLRFDLSDLAGHPVTNASLRFLGHSLNDQNAVNIEVAALDSDWTVMGAPFPTFNHAAYQPTLLGGSITVGLSTPEHTRDYEIDVTGPVVKWLSGILPNHGLQLRLTSTTTDNGIGIQTTGPNAIRLSIVQSPLRVLDAVVRAGSRNVTLYWNSAAEAPYLVETSDDLTGDWTPVGTATGTASGITSFTHRGALVDRDYRYYRIVHAP
jgi:arylsulfatase A-like enzyme